LWRFFFNGKSVDKIISNKKEEEERFEAFLSVQDPVDSNFLLEKTPALATSKPTKCENKHDINNIQPSRAISLKTPILIYCFFIQ
jgi:hypothetical protein